MPNLSINMEELPTLEGWEMGNMGQTPNPTKPAQSQASELAKEVVETPGEPAHESETQLEQNLVLVVDIDPQPTPSEQEDEYAGLVRRILTENPDIAQPMMEQLIAQPSKPLQSEEFQMVSKPVEIPSQAKVV